MEQNRQVKIYFSDFWNSFNYSDNFIIDAIRMAGFSPVVTADAPDYLFCSCMGRDHIKYDDCVKIFFSGENLSADFNIYDYAITSDYLSFADRHLRFPEFAFYLKGQQRTAIADLDCTDPAQRKFCNFVVSNGKMSSEERNRFFDMLSAYKKVDSGGRYMNNIGGPVDDKMAFIKGYKFTLAFENSKKDGYTTEKLLEPLMARTVPIYWGNPLVAKDFNPKAFINAGDYPSLEALLERVKQLDTDRDAYMAMLSEPIYPNGTDSDTRHMEALAVFLKAIFVQEKSTAFRRVTHGMTRQLMRDDYYLWKSESCKASSLLKKIQFFFFRHFSDAGKWQF